MTTEQLSAASRLRLRSQAVRPEELLRLSLQELLLLGAYRLRYVEVRQHGGVSGEVAILERADPVGPLAPPLPLVVDTLDWIGEGPVPKVVARLLANRGLMSALLRVTGDDLVARGLASRRWPGRRRSLKLTAEGLSASQQQQAAAPGADAGGVDRAVLLLADNKERERLLRASGQDGIAINGITDPVSMSLLWTFDTCFDLGLAAHDGGSGGADLAGGWYGGDLGGGHSHGHSGTC